MIKKPTNTVGHYRRKPRVKMKKKISIFLVLGFLFLVLSFLWWQDFLSPVDKKNKATKIFVVEKGESVKSIAEKLKREGLIKNAFLFQVLARKLRIAKTFQAGDFRLSSSMGAEEIAKELTHGTLDIWLTIPEGLRVEEIARRISSKFKVKSEKLIEEAKNYEGFLFPDTYLIPKDVNSQMIIKTMTDNFNRKVGELINLEKAKRGELEFNGLSLDELITLASLIEREGRNDIDRSKIASVLYNRLKVGMKLDVDATVQYALSTANCKLEMVNCNFWPKKLSHEDLTVESLYNTYLNNGLPPKPICNPGLSSIKAALTPATTDFWYYLSDKNGKMHFAKTLEEHNNNVKKYVLSNE